MRTGVYTTIGPRQSFSNSGNQSIGSSLPIHHSYTQFASTNNLDVLTGDANSPTSLSFSHQPMPSNLSSSPPYKLNSDLLSSKYYRGAGGSEGGLFTRALGVSTGGGIAASCVKGSNPRRRFIQSFVQLLVVMLVLLPLLLLATDHFGMSSRHAALVRAANAGKPGIRKLMDRHSPRHKLPAARLHNLVLVAGHAVYVGANYAQAADPQSWFLEDYQRIPGEVESFLEHIQLGVKAAEADPEALLLFSGGQTRLAAGPRSEGLSYWVVAEAANWFNTTGVRQRSFTEEHARDSFENLLFSLCRFFELTGHYPHTVTVISYNLKKARFETLHRAAMHFPATRFRFIGTELPPEATGALAGEAATVAAYTANPYGCEGNLLQKRLQRDPFAVGPIHPTRCPDLRALLQHCSTETFSGKLPWDMPYPSRFAEQAAATAAGAVTFGHARHGAHSARVSSGGDEGVAGEVTFGHARHGAHSARVNSGDEAVADEGGSSGNSSSRDSALEGVADSLTAEGGAG